MNAFRNLNPHFRTFENHTFEKHDPFEYKNETGNPGGGVALSITY